MNGSKFKDNLEVLWVKLEQMLQFKVGCSNFALFKISPCPIYPIEVVQSVLVGGFVKVNCPCPEQAEIRTVNFQV